MAGGATNIDVIECNFLGVTVIAESSSKVTVTDSSITYASKRAVAVQGQGEVVLMRNHITNNPIGILVYMNGTITAKENLIYANREYGFLGYNPKGVIEGNSIYQNGLRYFTNI